MMEVAAFRVGENVDLGRVNGTQEPIGLIAVWVEMTVDGGNHAVDLEAFALGHIESAVDQDLDLEPLEKAMVLTVLIIPALDTPTLEADPFPIETRRDLEAARVIADHGPGVAAATTSPRHGLERGLAVGVTGVPVTGATKPLRVEILGSGTKSLGHLGAAEIALTGGTATSILATPKAFDGSLQCIFAMAGHELRYKRSEPVRCFLQQFSACFSPTVEGGVAGTQQCQAPVAWRLGVRKCEQRLGKGAVGDRLISHHRG